MNIFLSPGQLRWIFTLALVAAALSGLCGRNAAHAKTVALWLFDEQAGIYPSCVLGDAASGEMPLVIGLGGQLVEGKFGRALEPSPQPDTNFPSEHLSVDFGGERRRAETEEEDQRLVDSYDAENPHALLWSNARFCALMTRGEDHLRQEVDFASPTRSKLNLGDFDWTVEFWYYPNRKSSEDGVVFELGTGPRGKNEQTTSLRLRADRKGFVWHNQPSKSEVFVPSDPVALDSTSPEWHHLCFVYDSESDQLRHYVDGRLQQLPEKFQLKKLPKGEDDYFSVGRNGLWNKALPGRIDELRISDTQVYTREFEVPRSFSRLYGDVYTRPSLKKGPPLLFAGKNAEKEVVELGARKHVFIDDALVDESHSVEFRVNPPRLDGKVWPSGLSNHLSVFQDDNGIIRLYGSGPRQSLAVLFSKDGVHWEAPDLGREYRGARNVVIEDPVGLGTLFIDPNAPSDERIKYYSGYRGRGHYVYSSPDGIHFKRNETSALPFRGASQSIVYYDAQRQRYVGFHRSDMLRTPAGKSKRSFVLTETIDVMRPWPFQPMSLDEQLAKAQQIDLGSKLPYFVDNGPLTPPGFGIEYLHAFGPDESLDPVGTDIYVPKCVKYPFAPDTYLAFPIVYFHYHGDGPATRRALGKRDRERGSGPLETQLAVSRDGIRWQRYPRPAYIGIGNHDGMDLKKTYIAHGLVRRGPEIWQYYVGSEKYHSAWTNNGREAVFRAVQRVDGFVSADTPYTGGTLVTRPLKFKGNRLVLNINTGATGYAQVGLLDEKGKPIEGYNVDDCVYINGDFIDKEVEWLGSGRDLSRFEGQPVRLSFRMHGSKLYSMQFVE